MMNFVSGVLLGLGMILPIGPQNVFILSQSIIGGTKRGLTAAIAAGFCDTTLIILGATGLSAILSNFPWLKGNLLWLGTVFLLYLGLSSLSEARGISNNRSADFSIPTAVSESGFSGLILKTIAVSWGNPHAIIDTVAILGSAIAAHNPSGRMSFAVGIIGASWLFFFFLTFLGQLIRKRVQGQVQLWLKVISGIIMLVFGVVFGWEALTWTLR